MKTLQHSFLIFSLVFFYCMITQPIVASDTNSVLVLDSIYTYDGSNLLKVKDYYSYDQWGNRSKSETYTWNVNRYVGSLKYIYVYNADGKQLEWEYHHWDYSTHTWRPSRRQESVYEGLNNTQSIQLAWDVSSSAWVAVGKTLMQYDSNRNLVSHEQYDWDQLNNKWVGSYKYTQMYDVKGYPISYTTYHWDDLTSTWVEDVFEQGEYDYDYTYDNNNNLTKVVFKVMNKDTQTWSDSLKWEYTINGQNKTIRTESFIITPEKSWDMTAYDVFDYDQNGNRILEEKYYYEATADSLIGSQKSTWMYDVNGYMTQHIIFNWDFSTGQWTPGSKDQTAFTQNGMLTATESYYWDNVLSQWIGSNKSEYAYEQNGDINMDINSMWDYSGNTWYISQKTMYAFDEIGRNVSIHRQSWDYNKNSLVNSSKETTTYHENGKVSTNESFTWNDSQSSWIPYSKIDYTYDAHANLIVKQTFFWINTSNAYSSYERIEYYYSALVTGMNNIHHAASAFDVRTADGTLIINFAPASRLSTVRVFDANGRLVNVVSGSNGSVQHIKTAKSGIYMVTDGKTTVKLRAN